MKAFSWYQDSHFDGDYGVHVVGMKLAPDTEEKIKKRLDSLHLKSPMNCRITLEYSYAMGVLRGELSIIGPGLLFQSSMTGSDPWEIFVSLEKDVDSQLLSWKKTRFQSKSPDVVQINYKKKHLQGVTS